MMTILRVLSVVMSILRILNVIYDVASAFVSLAQVMRGIRTRKILQKIGV